MRRESIAHSLRRAAGVAGIVGAVGAFASLLPIVMHTEEILGLATLFALRGPIPPPDDVVLVSVSRDSARRLGLSSDLEEWPRALHADLVGALRDAGATTIVFDVIFDKPREPGGDEAFAAAIAQAGNVVLAERVEEPDDTSLGTVERRTPPLSKLQAGTLVTAPFTLPVVPIRVAQFWPFGRLPGDVPSLPVAGLQAHLLSSYEPLRQLVSELRPQASAALPSRARLREAQGELQRAMQILRGIFRTDPSLVVETRAAVAASSLSAHERARLRALIDTYASPDSRYLNFYGPAGTIETIPYDVALFGGAADRIAGRAVFVGFAERRQPEQQDDFYSVFSQRTGLNLSGVEIGATAFANLLESSSIVPLARGADLLLVLVWGAGLALCVWLAPVRGAIVIAAAAAGYFAGAYALFTTQHLWLPLVVPLALQAPVSLGLMVWLRYKDVATQRERIQTVLGYYVPPAVVQRLAHETIDATANRQLLYGTCLFTDAERYTTLAEALPPERLAAVMSEYYEVMFAAVERYGGLVSDTAGDAMVAVWTSARPDPAARERACRAALDIEAAVAEFNRVHADRQLPTRIGLESGPLVLGNIGAAQRFEYRAIGDIVNTAARLQDLNRVLGTHVLASGTTVAGLEVPHRPLGSFLLRGKSVPVEIHELLAAPLPRQEGELLALALAALRSGSWQEAEERFSTLLTMTAENGPYAFYARLAGDYVRNPPAVWRGAVEITAR